LNVSDFVFDLPDELIAQDAEPRGAARLLVLDRGTGARHHGCIADLPSRLRAGDLLVVNNTRVFAARLLGHRVPGGGHSPGLSKGGAVECLLLAPPEPAARTITAGLRPGSTEHSSERGPQPRPERESPATDRGSHLAQALMHPGQKLKPGTCVRFEGSAGVLMAEVLEQHFHGRRTIRLWSESSATVDTLVDALGHVPLPPYIKRPDTPQDRERYQTVFARARGSVAAPTAGLHFTEDLLAALDREGIGRVEVTLHVGYGTFKPVREGRVEDHVVDPEPYEIAPAAADAIACARDEGRRVIAVGTTTTRALEDAALRGNGRIAAGAAEASLFIYPGYRFRAIDGLLTNFHLPSSSLLMLVAAFAGRERVLEAYREAIEQRYRFYSYGDAMLFL
jgi:S-adenosylmethionine:tRNA ribosyltransferase-isomerase